MGLDKFKQIPKLHELTNNEVNTLQKLDNKNVIKFLDMI